MSVKQCPPTTSETVNAWEEALAEPGFRERLRAATERERRGEFVEHDRTRRNR